MATSNGVVKYNGVALKIFNVKDGLPQNEIWRLKEDKSGRIWLFANSYKFGFIAQDVYHEVQLSVKGTYVAPMQIATRGDVTLFTYMEHGIHKLALVKDNMTIAVSLITLNRLANIGYILLGTDGTLLLTSHSKGVIYKISLCDPRPDKILVCNHAGNFVDEIGAGNATVSLGSDFYRLVRQQNHMMHIDLSTGRRSELYLDTTDDGDKIVIAEGFDDHIQITTRKNVYYLWKKAGGTHIEKKPLPAFLRSEKISYVGIGKDSAEWVCTYDDGIWIRPPYALLSKWLKAFGKVGDAKLAGNIGRNIYWWNDKNHELITTEGGRIIARKEFPALGDLRYINGLSTNSLLLTTTKGVYIWRPQKGTLTDFFKNPKPIIAFDYRLYTNKAANERIRDSTRIYYFANPEKMAPVTDSSYIFCFVGIGNLLTVHKDEMRLRKLMAEKPVGFARDTIDGLFILYGRQEIYLYNRLWQAKKLAGSELEALGVGNIQNILVTAWGDFIVHCSDRMLYYSRSRRTMTRLPIGFDLTSSYSFIYRDNLIVVGSSGFAYSHLSKAKKAGSFRLLADEATHGYNTVSGTALDGTGTLWLTTDRGSLSINVDSVLQEPDVFTFSRDSMILPRLRTPFELSLHNNDTLNIQQNPGNISLDAISCFPGDPWQCHYRSKNGSWKVSSSGEIYLEDTRPGRYSKIQYYFQNDRWTSNLFNLYIYQVPLWYQTSAWKVSIGIIGILFFGLSLLAVSYFTKKLVAKANDKKRWQTELELRAIHSQINPHFIFNTLSTALFYISKQRSSEAYDHVSRFSKLLRGYLKSSRERFIRLSDEIEMLEQYIKLQNARFQQPFDYEIKMDSALEASKLLIPSLLIQPLVENAINHGLFHKGAGGKLLIEFRRGATPTELVCTIDDNGVGRAHARQLQNKARESFGSALTADLINVFEKYEQMDIKMEYIDKQLPESGTIVKLILGNVKSLS